MKKELYRIINEEISNFDFLGATERVKKYEIIKIVNERKFQRDFIYDYITNSNDLEYIGSGETFVKTSNDNNNNIICDFTYSEKFKYDYIELDESIILEIELVGNGINIRQYNKNEIDYGIIDWGKLDLYLYINDNKIHFIEYEEASENIKNILIRKLGQEYLVYSMNQNLIGNFKTDISEIGDYKY